MKILFLCHRLPYPPKRGGKIRPFNMIRHLAQTHEVHVASLARSVAEAREGEGLTKFCARSHVGIVNDAVQTARMVVRLPTFTPSSFGYFYSASLARRVREALAHERFDLIFVHCSSVAQYVEDAEGV